MGKINKREPYPVSLSRPKLRSRYGKSTKLSCTFFSDALLLPRINKYLADHKDQVFIDVNNLVDELQGYYREYGRRRRSAFKPLVERALACIVHNSDNSDTSKMKRKRKHSGVSGNPPETSSSDSDSSESSVISQRKTSSNSQIMRLYSSRPAPPNQGGAGPSRPELIELSSDEEIDEPVDIRRRRVANELRVLQAHLNHMNREFRTNCIPGRYRGSARPLPRYEPHRDDRNDPTRAIPRTLKRPQSGARTTFADFGGDECLLEEVCKLILHIPHPEIYRGVGVKAPCGILLHGPPGCGKTLLAKAIAGQMNVELIQVSAPELIGGVSGESEQRIRELFDKAYRSAPCVLFIDEVDAITPNRELAQKEMERRIVAQLLTCLDALSSKPNGDRVLLIGATNRPDSLDPALRRAGRFDREVCLGIPDVRAREKILRVLCTNLNLAEDFSFEELAQNTPGYVGADLQSLTREAALVAVNRILGQLEAMQNQGERPKRRRTDSGEDADIEPIPTPPEEVVLEDEEDPLPAILAENEIMLRQAEEAISQNYANEQHSLQVRQAALDAAEAGPSNRVDMDEENGFENNVIEVPEIDMIHNQEERAMNENMANEIIEQIKLANELALALLDEDINEAEIGEEPRPPQQEQSNEEHDEEAEAGDGAAANAAEAEADAEGAANAAEADAEGAANAAEAEAEADAEGAANAAEAESEADAEGAANDAETESEADTEGAANAAETESEADTEGAANAAETESEADTEGEDNAAEPEEGADFASESDDEIGVLFEEAEIIANDSPSLDALIRWLNDPTPLDCRQLANVCITQDDFRRALRSVQPSAKREGFATVPDVTWDDVGSLADVRSELTISILGPVRFRRHFEALGIRGPAGVLICGPPGCGKTLLAKAVANEAGINFISVKGPELLNMYVGESERAVRRCFQRARNSAPCVIFFDELDALCPRRSEFSENGATRRVVNQLLTEMDGVEDRKEVYLMAATNRPDIIDPAVLRPGRLDRVIYVGLPEPHDRVDILRAVTKNGTSPRLGPDVNLEEIARRPQCDGFSGADLAALVREAGVQAVKSQMGEAAEDFDDSVSVGLEHFERAFEKVQPSVSPEDRAYYERMRIRYTTRRQS